MDNINTSLADIDAARMDEDQPISDAPIDENIAKLLQTVREVSALMGTESTAPAVTEEPDAGSDFDSSSELDSSSSDSDMEDEDDRANMLKMIAEGDDDDEDQVPSNSVPVTRNEVVDLQIPELTIRELPETAQLTSLGTIHSIVDHSVIIQAHISGERHVLDSESILSFDNRKVLGLVYDVFGPVSRPMYTVRVREIDRECIVVGRGVYFAPGWVKMLATEKLRVKGTDASNEYDEEVGDDGMEFSDDEEERIHRKQAKKSRQQAAHNKTLNAGLSTDPASAANVAPRGAAPPSLASTTPAAPQNVRKLQSYQDLYDAELGF